MRTVAAVSGLASQAAFPSSSGSSDTGAPSGNYTYPYIGGRRARNKPIVKTTLVRPEERQRPGKRHERADRDSDLRVTVAIGSGIHRGYRHGEGTLIQDNVVMAYLDILNVAHESWNFWWRSKSSCPNAWGRNTLRCR